MLLSVAMLAGAGAMCAQTFTQGALKYTVTGGTEVSVACNDKSSTSPIVIPSTVSNGGVTYTVTSIDNFKSAKASAITIPATVKSMISYAFEAGAMESVTFEEGSHLAEISDHAFIRCVNLKEFDVPEGVTNIAGYAFEGTTSMTTMTLPSTLKTLANGAFYNLGGDKSANMQSMTFKAFNPPSGSNSAFQNWQASSTCKFYVPNQSVDAYKASPVFSLFKDGTNIEGADLGELKFPVDGLTLGNLKYMPVDAKSVSVAVEPDSKGVAFDAVIPATISHNGNSFAVTEIADNAFQGTKITSVVIPEGITYIGSYAFQNAKGINSVAIPASVSIIGQNAFQYCEGLTSITFAEGSKLSAINSHTFNNCINVTEFAIPEGVNSLGQWSLESMKSLTTLTLPSTLTRLNGGALARCASLTTLKVNAVNPPAVDNANVFDGVNVGECDLIVPESSVSAYKKAQYWNEFGNMSIAVVIGPIRYAVNENGTVTVSVANKNAKEAVEILPTVTIKDKEYTVTNIGELAFEYSQIYAITMPNTITTIETQAFQRAKEFESITIPASVKEIGVEAFHWDDSKLKSVVFEEGSQLTEFKNGIFNGCTLIEALTIPEGVTKIGDYAFNNMKACKTLQVNNAVPPTVTNANAFNSFPVNTCTLVIPQGSKEAYAADPIWSKFTNVEEKVMTGVEVVVDSTDGAAVYYNMMGVKVENPSAGLYIVVKDGKASKVLVK